MGQDKSAKRREPLVGWWLLIIALLTAAMVLVGGATRLTDSGLSITEWDLAKGLLPPLSDARWAEEFALYQRTVEYQTENRGMSLAEFQGIYWWEWGHRFMGKAIGVVFALPFLFFWATGRLRGRLLPVLGLFALGGLQGAIGWWMVTSGLFSDVDVSPERLAVHLCVAFTILAVALWLALDCFDWPREGGAPGGRWLGLAVMALILGQVMFGAFLAGDRGGPAYQDWPLIGGHLIPPTAFELRPIINNFVQNHATEHFMHRSLAYVVALAALLTAALALWRARGAARGAGLALGGLVVAQFVLGVMVVLHATPMSLSLAHQAGAVLLWAAATVFTRAARAPVS
jgi:cytochrome c oxidase assembly protein subunit 15